MYALFDWSHWIILQMAQFSFLIDTWAISLRPSLTWLLDMTKADDAVMLFKQGFNCPHLVWERVVEGNSCKRTDKRAVGTGQSASINNIGTRRSKGIMPYRSLLISLVDIIHRPRLFVFYFRVGCCLFFKKSSDSKLSEETTPATLTKANT